MDSPRYLLFSFFKGLLVTGVIGIALAAISFFITFLFDLKNVRLEKNHLSTGVGNALMTMHFFFDPGAKPMTEQVIWVKRKRTRLEKGILGLDELGYDKVIIKGYKRIYNKRYTVKKAINLN